MKLRNILINWSIEFAPIIIYFVMLWVMGDTQRGFVISTGVFTLSTVTALAVAYAREERIAIFAGVAGIFIIGFGIATVWLDNPHVFMFETTAYNAFFALVLLPGLFSGKGGLKHFFIGLFDLQEEGWYKLSLHYFILFVAIAVSNEYVWRTFSQETWIIVKYVASASTIGLGFFEIPLGKRYRNPTASAWGVRVTSKADAKKRDR
jgi:intracellular septation protein